MSKIGLTMLVLLAVGLSAALQPLNAVAGPTEGLVAYYPFDGHAAGPHAAPVIFHHHSLDKPSWSRCCAT